MKKLFLFLLISIVFVSQLEAFSIGFGGRGGGVSFGIGSPGYYDGYYPYGGYYPGWGYGGWRRGGWRYGGWGHHRWR